MSTRLSLSAAALLLIINVLGCRVCAGRVAAAPTELYSVSIKKIKEFNSPLQPETGRLKHCFSDSLQRNVPLAPRPQLKPDEWISVASRQKEI